jgi:hypothetical protein
MKLLRFIWLLVAMLSLKSFGQDMTGLERLIATRNYPDAINLVIRYDSELSTGM